MDQNHLGRYVTDAEAALNGYTLQLADRYDAFLDVEGEDPFVRLLRDLMHYADQNYTDFQRALTQAREQYARQRRGEHMLTYGAGVAHEGRRGVVIGIEPEEDRYFYTVEFIPDRDTDSLAAGDLKYAPFPEVHLPGGRTVHGPLEADELLVEVQARLVSRLRQEHPEPLAERETRDRLLRAMCGWSAAAPEQLLRGLAGRVDMEITRRWTDIGEPSPPRHLAAADFHDPVPPTTGPAPIAAVPPTPPEAQGPARHKGR